MNNSKSQKSSRKSVPQPKPNDQRAVIKNSNNSQYHAGRRNRAQQVKASKAGKGGKSK